MSTAERTRTQTHNLGVYTVGTLGAIEFHVCGECGLTWGMPESFIDARRKDGRGWKCPNGHSWTFPIGPSNAEKLKREREETARLRARLDQERAHSRTLKGVVTKTKNKLAATEERIAGGVCPCCKRTFKELARHMKTKHPDYAKEPA